MFSLDQCHVVNVLPPNADVFAGTVNTDIVKAMGGSVTFFVILGTVATGTTTVTIEACDDNVPTTTSAVAFMYRTYAATDLPGAWTACAATGFTTAATTNYMYEIRVDVGDLGALGYEYVRLHAVEVVNDPSDGSVLCIVENLRDASQPLTLL